MNDLSAYAAIADRLPQIDPDDHLVIQPDDFPAALGDHAAFDGMVIDTSFMRTITRPDDADQPFHILDRTRGFDAYALPDGYRRIGLWLLHLLFSGRDWAGLPTQPGSRARFLYAQVLRPPTQSFGLQVQAPAGFSGYVHRPLQVWRHPFTSTDMTPIQRLDPMTTTAPSSPSGGARLSAPMKDTSRRPTRSSFRPRTPASSPWRA